MTAILASDVFPGLDKKDPLETKEEESIPTKFLAGKHTRKID